MSACNAQISGAPPGQTVVDAANDAIPAIDAPAASDASLPDSPPVDAAVTIDAPLGAWSTPTKIAVAATALVEDDVTLSSNTLELFFAVNTSKGKDLFYTSRASVADPWATPTALPFNNANQSDETPRLSADDKTLFFASGRAGNGTLDIFQVTRASAGSTVWGTVTALDSTINTTDATEKWFMPCGTNHYVMIQDAGGGGDLVEGTIGGGDPTPIGPLNSGGNETGTFLSADCLTIFFASSRASPSRMFTAQRAAIGDAWPAPTRVDDFAATGGNQEDPWISSDGRTFAFASDAAGGGNKDLYLSTR